MRKNFEHIDDLLGKYLAGEASDQERQEVREWLTEDEENIRYFDQVKLIFEKAADVSHLQEFNTDVAWNKVRSRLKNGSTSANVTDQGSVISIDRSTRFIWYRVAAAIIILFGVAWYLFRPSTDPMTTTIEVISERTAVSDTLPGGSDVFLNKQSRLAYVYNKETQTHEVKLSGEAYFNINKRKREDFVVDAGGVFIRDIGTSFNVRAYPGSDEVEVLVEEGEVSFFTADNPGISLKASGKGVYNKKTKAFTIEKPEPNITAYKTRFFVFDAADLESMAEALNHVYDKQVVVPENLKKCTITVTFRDESIEEIAEVVAETLGLTTLVEGDRIILEGEGCE